MFARCRVSLAAFGVCLAIIGAGRVAEALSIAVESAAPVATGVAQTLRVTNVGEAVGNVTFTWNFGDGSPATAPSSSLTATHTYQSADHYTVIVQATDTTTSVTSAFVQTVHHPLTTAPPHNSTSIFVDAAHHEVWNVNPDSDSVSCVDAVTLTRVREVRVGREPHSLAQAPDSSIWVANQKSDEVVVIDRNTGGISTRIALPYASQPLGIAFGPTGKAYVSLFATGKLVEIDGATRKVERQVDLGPTPAGIAVAHDGRIYVTRFISPLDHGEIWVVLPDTFKLVKTIPLAFDTSDDSAVSGRGVPNFVGSMVISPDGTQAWVTAKKDNVARGPQRDGRAMNPDNFVRSLVCSIDMQTEQEVVTRRQDIDNRAMPASLVFSPYGDYGYLSLVFNNEISISDAYAFTNVGALRGVGSAPDGVALAADGKLFINAFLSREVVVYDMSASIKSLDQGAPPALAHVRTIDKESLPADVLLGKQIFFNAMDTRMSEVGYMSCATCHLSGLSDGRVWDFTDRGEGLRNTKLLLGTRGAMGQGRLHWSGNMDEVQDFERDIRDSQGGTGFMAKDVYDAHLTGPNHTYDTFGQPAAGASKELDGLAAFLTSLNQAPKSPFRNPDGSFTTNALAGRQIFARARCGDCHSGPDFTDSAKGMLHDVGTLLPTSGMRLGGKLIGTDTPSLKGVWQSAPYLHDGRAQTLEEIFTKYLTHDEMGKTSDLSPAELGQLVEYLKELDDVPEPTIAGGASGAGGGGGTDSALAGTSGSSGTNGSGASTSATSGAGSAGTNPAVRSGVAGQGCSFGRRGGAPLTPVAVFALALLACSRRRKAVNSLSPTDS